REVVATARRAVPAGGGWLGEAEVKALLAQRGVSVPEGRTVRDETECLGAAEAIGYPVALKLSGPDIQHKSDLGAVILGVEDETGLAEACRRLIALPAAANAELLVEAMVPPGAELIVSAGSGSVVPNLVVGLGGIWTEAFEDAAVIPLPASPDRVREALFGLRGAPVLEGARGTEPVDLEAVADLASKVGELLVEEGLSLIELNPVIADPSGAIAADAIAKSPRDGYHQCDARAYRYYPLLRS
ncbi:MAG: acetate--CoA ligase family protein, partial [Solirubrobacterales bacterium]